MKKLNMAFILIIIICMFIYGCKTNDELNYEDKSLLNIKEKGYMIIGIDDAFPPMGFIDKDTGQVIGFDIDVSREVCKRLGLEARYQPINWSTKEMELSNGDIDCVWNGLSKTDELNKAMNLSVPYMKNNPCVLVRKDSGYKTLDDIKGKILCLQTDSSAEHAIEKNLKFKYNFSSIIDVDTYTKAILEINNKTVDCIAIDEVVARYYMVNFPDTYRLISQEDGQTLSLAYEEYVIGFRKRDNSLKLKIEEILTDMSKDGSLAEISKKWFEEDITTIKNDIFT